MYKILFFLILIYSPLTFATSKTSVSEYSILIDEDWSSVMFIYRDMDNDEIVKKAKNLEKKLKEEKLQKPIENIEELYKTLRN